MKPNDDNLRERLLARLPQPENVAAYREETSSLLAKHERALFWEKLPSPLFIWLATGIIIITNFSYFGGYHWGPNLEPRTALFLQISAGVLLFIGSMIGLAYNINRNKVDLLKEVKQVQLQVLELQAALEKSMTRGS